jgi:hypothetical protein
MVPGKVDIIMYKTGARPVFHPVPISIQGELKRVTPKTARVLEEWTSQAETITS